MRRWKGSASLIFDTVGAVTDLVRRTEDSVINKCFDVVRATTPFAPIADEVHTVQHAIRGQIYGSIHSINRGMRTLVDKGLQQAEDAGIELPSKTSGTPLRSDAIGSFSWIKDNAQATLNGFVGDHLDAHDNGLALEMCFVHAGHPVNLTTSTARELFENGSHKVCIFVHGLAATEWCWSSFAEAFYGDPGMHFGSMLAEEGYTPLYVRYNSGKHISRNGRALDALLQQLVALYPHSIDELVLIGHSMGGLVSRSAVHLGAENGSSWMDSLRYVLCLGSPHLGSPVEKGAHLLSSLFSFLGTPATRVLSEILEVRSDGIKDLRFGYTLDEEWQQDSPSPWLVDGRLNAPLVDGVGYGVVAATVTKDALHPIGQLVGDLLVRLPSASGTASEPERHIPFQSSVVVEGMSHLHLCNHPEVYKVIRQLLLG